MPRRENHSGTRPYRVGNRWAVSVMLGGKRHKLYGATAEAAKAAKDALVREWEQGLEPLDPRYTVCQWLADWQRLYLSHLAPRTRESYAETVKLYRNCPSRAEIELSPI